MAYFEHCHTDQLTSSNSVEPRGRHNFEGRRRRWGVPGRTLGRPKSEPGVPPGKKEYEDMADDDETALK